VIFVFSIGIVISSWHYYANPFQPQPLNELYFATLIDKIFKCCDIAVEVIDLRETRIDGSQRDINNIPVFVDNHDLFFYWVVKTADFDEVVSVVRQLRDAYPNSKHVSGGTHIQNYFDQSAKIFDAVIKGPGEECLICIINDIKAGQLRKKYIGDWKSVHYADYPYPNRDYLPKKSIVNRELFKEYGGVLGTSAMFSRGCNFSCTYCVYNVPKIIQRRSLKSIENEISYLKYKYGITGLNLRDEICIPLSKKDSIPFIDTMGKQDLIWRGQTRVFTDKKVLALAYEAGCVELAIGVESASQRVLDIIKKAQKINKVKEMINICKKVGVKVKMCLILGLPGEPPNIRDLTISLIEETNPDYVSVSGFCPVLGSDIYKNKKYYGIRHINEDWCKHAHLMCRYSDKEDYGLPFEYEKRTQWGESFTRQEIMENILEIQRYLRGHSMSY
jgi:radical SAM superfamily enzyme YgiQ (UPF0313 family)